MKTNKSAGWLRLQHKELSPFGEVVADILGKVFRGIYHIDRSVLRTDWTHPEHIRVNLQHFGLSTFDDSTLTILVLLCHELRVRLEISGKGPNIVCLAFTCRYTGKDPLHDWHPNVSEMLTRLGYAPSDHS